LSYRIENDGGGEASLFLREYDSHPCVRVHKMHQQPGFAVNFGIRGPIQIEEAKELVFGLLQLLIFSGLAAPDVLDKDWDNEITED
jgi:hypothetical protein